MTSADVQLAVLNEQIVHMRRDMAAHREEAVHAMAGLREEIKDLKHEVDEIKSYAQRGRGALFVLMAVGGALATLISQWGNITKAFK